MGINVRCTMEVHSQDKRNEAVSVTKICPINDIIRLANYPKVIFESMEMSHNSSLRAIPK